MTFNDICELQASRFPKVWIAAPARRRQHPRPSVLGNFVWKLAFNSSGLVHRTLNDMRFAADSETGSDSQIRADARTGKALRI